MNVALEIERLISNDIDDVIAWGSRVDQAESKNAYELAASIVSNSNSSPLLKVKGLALTQAIVHRYPELMGTSLTVDALAKQIETTDHPELQYWCSRVMAEILADCQSISDEYFDNGVSLLRCLMRTSVHPYTREFIAATFSRGTPLKNRIRERLMTKRLPVWAFLGKLATPHKLVSRQYAREYGIDWVSFGDFVRAVAKQRKLDHESKNVLQTLGQELVDQDPDAFCRNVLAQASDWEPGLPIVVDSIRHEKIVQALRKIVAPCDVVLLKVEVEPAVLEMRLEKELPDRNAIEAAKTAPTEREFEKLSQRAVVARYVGTASEQVQLGA